MNIQNIVNFIFELGHLKRQEHSGWKLAGVKNPDSVAEHVAVAAQIAYILCEMENESNQSMQVNPEKVACMILFHDNAESRTMDQHKVASRYYSKKDAEEKAFAEQISLLNGTMIAKLKQYDQEYSTRTTKEGIIAKDADWLEVAFQAKEYIDQGYESCWEFINNVEKAVETESAKKLITTMKNTKFTDWWKDLKKMTYTKL